VLPWFTEGPTEFAPLRISEHSVPAGNRVRPLKPALTVCHLIAPLLEKHIMQPRFRISLLVLTAAMLGLDTARAQAQTTQPVSLPANWQQMSPIALAAAIRPLFDQDTFKLLSQADQAAVKERGKELFLQIDLTSSSLSYQTIEVLHHLARYELDLAQIDSARTTLSARQDNWAGQPYDAIRAKVVMMMRLEVPDPAIVNEARRWVQAGGTYQQVPQTDLKYDVVRAAFSDVNIISGAFSVQWSGRISAPLSGDYTFFISPINLNAGFIDPPIKKFNMEVAVGGQTILTGEPSDSGHLAFPAYQQGMLPPTAPWTSQSKAVTLTAGTPANLMVTLTVDAIGQLPERTLHAMLYWQGPGMAKSLVPASALTSASGAPGLRASYSWSSKGQPQNLTRTDPMIDFAWTTPRILLSQNTSIAQQAADTMWENGSSTDFINSLLGPPANLHPFIRDMDDASEGLSTARRQAFFELVLSNPSLLDPVDPKTAVRFYQAFRLGTPERALDVFGAWATRHADLTCQMSNEVVFDGDNRFWLAALAISTTQQLPAHATRLQTEFLQLPDGRCSLPVAYALCYSYLGREKLGAWIQFLETKLADPAIAGDLRVNWLLARAHAQEHTRATFNHYPNRWFIPLSWPLDGQKYVSQALQAAQTPAVKARVAQEMTGRLAASGQFDAAVSLLQSVAPSLSHDAAATVAALQQRLQGFAADRTKAEQAQPAVSTRAYIDVLQARRAQAASRGDANAVRRYDSIISSAQTSH
jgi:hypothetical protein